jgi:hypothetical protein
MSAGRGNDREIFVFPIAVFCDLIEKAITRKSKKLLHLESSVLADKFKLGFMESVEA